MQVRDLEHLDSLVRPAIGFYVESEASHRFDAHTHRKAQLLYVISGNVAVETDDGVWLVPPSRAVWIPGGTAHATFNKNPVKAGCIFIEPDISDPISVECGPICVQPLLHELVQRLVDLTVSNNLTGTHEEHLVSLMLDELAWLGRSYFTSRCLRIPVYYASSTP